MGLTRPWLKSVRGYSYLRFLHSCSQCIMLTFCNVDSLNFWYVDCWFVYFLPYFHVFILACLLLPPSGPSGWLPSTASQISMGRRTCPRSLLTFWTDVLRCLLIIIWSKYYTSGECWRSMDSRTVEGSPVSSDVSAKKRDPTTYSENKRAKTEKIAFTWQYLSIAWKWQGKTGWKNFTLAFKFLSM